MKPWEGKHWLDIHNEIRECADPWDICSDVALTTLVELENALVKDWEEQHKEKICAQTAEKEKSGHQELFRTPSYLAVEKKDRLIKNLFNTIKMQQDEIEELKAKFHEEKKAESFTSSN